MNIRADTIIHEELLHNGMVEAATGDRMARDQLIEFWSTFYFKCCNGKQLEVPSISPYVTVSQWEADERVFVYGVVVYCDYDH